MKKFLKTAGLPIGVFALAISAAFATNAMNNSAIRLASDYYYQNSDEYSCIKVDEQLNCSEINTGIICTWEDASSLPHDIYTMEKDLNGIDVCAKTLYRQF